MVNIKTCHPVARIPGMETSAPLINAIVNNALLHFNSRIKQMPPQIIHTLHFLWTDRFRCLKIQ